MPLANVVMPIAIPEVLEAEARGLVHVKIKRLVALHSPIYNNYSSQISFYLFIL